MVQIVFTGSGGQEVFLKFSKKESDIFPIFPYIYYVIYITAHELLIYSCYLLYVYDSINFYYTWCSKKNSPDYFFDL